VIVEIRGLDELNARLVKIANGSMEAMKQGAFKTMLRVEREAKQLVPTKTGLLKTSIRAGTLEDGAYASAGGGNGLKDIRYAPYVEYGTGPHDIYPVNAKALSWKGAGGQVFASHVHHPGTKAKPFFTPAVESAMKYAEADMKEAVDRLIEAT
jgi:hypothetical protein